jgi:hypothetical protein
MTMQRRPAEFLGESRWRIAGLELKVRAGATDTPDGSLGMRGYQAGVRGRT